MPGGLRAAAAAAGRDAPRRRGGDRAARQLHGGREPRAARRGEGRLETLPGPCQRAALPLPAVDPSANLAPLAGLGFRYDSSVGFSDAPGFRAGIAQPYRPWDHDADEPAALVEIPLAVMDVTLAEERYLGLSATAAERRLHALIEWAAENGGGFSVLWHTDRFDPATAHGWDRLYVRFIETVRAAGGVCLPAGRARRGGRRVASVTARAAGGARAALRAARVLRGGPARARIARCLAAPSRGGCGARPAARRRLGLRALPSRSAAPALTRLAAPDRPCARRVVRLEPRRDLRRVSPDVRRERISLPDDRRSRDDLGGRSARCAPGGALAARTGRLASDCDRRRRRPRPVRGGLVGVDSRGRRRPLPSRPREEARRGAGPVLGARRQRVPGRRAASRVRLPALARRARPRRAPGRCRPGPRRAPPLRRSHAARARLRLRGRRGALRVVGRRRGRSGRAGRARRLPGRRHRGVRDDGVAAGRGTTPDRACRARSRLRLHARRAPTHGC